MTTNEHALLTFKRGYFIKKTLDSIKLLTVHMFLPEQIH